MMKFYLQYLPLFLFFFVAHSLFGLNNERVRLTDIDVLTLHKGKYTHGRRSNSIPQIDCVGGSAHCAFIPEVVQCKNMGSDGYDVQWKCEADMSDKYRFGKLQVSCEGYDHPNDPYILRGSCGLRFHLDLTEKGQRQQYQTKQDTYDSGYDHDYQYPTLEEDSWGAAFRRMVQVFVILVVLYSLYKICFPSSFFSSSAEGSQPYSGWRSFFNRGQGETLEPGAPTYSYPSYGYKTPSDASTNTGSGWGFWSGAGLGGTLGYLLGNRSRRNQDQYTYQSHRPQYRAHSSPYVPRERPRSPESESTRTATGYGETSRR